LIRRCPKPHSRATFGRCAAFLLPGGQEGRKPEKPAKTQDLAIPKTQGNYNGRKTPEMGH